MNLYDQISSNKRNSIFLVFIFLIMIIILGSLIGLILGYLYLGLIISILISVLFIFIGYYSGNNMILSMSHAKEVTKKEDPYLVNTIEGLAIAAGIPTPKIYIIQEDSMNAFATGRDPKNSSITVTSGLRSKMNREELEGVIAHEMSHIKNYDIRLMMLATVLVGIIVLLSDFLLRSFLWGPKDSDNKNGGIIVIVAIVIGLLLAILSPIIAQIIQLSISRKREYLADANGALLCRNPRGLANALKKISKDTDKVVDTANKATAHLYIENPLRHMKGSINRLFNTHPSIEDRIKKLESMY